MTTKDQGFQTVKLTEIEPWPKLNPRRSFDQEALQELADSIKADGLLQPVAVAPAGLQKKGVKFWLFAGERRLRACKLAGLKTIDVIVHDVKEATAHRLAGVENLDRDDLTSIEEAVWLRRELELNQVSQKALGEDLGRSQAWIANRVRLLELPKSIQDLIHAGTIAPAMARDTLLRFLKLGKKLQPKLWREIAKEIKRAAKGGADVVRADLEDAAHDALRTCEAVQIRAGYHYQGHNYNRGGQVTDAHVKAFLQKHADRCVQIAVGYQRAEVTYTFASTEWDALIGEAVEKAAATRSTGGVPKKKLEKPKLGPTQKPVDLQELRQKFGHDNVILFSQVVDPSKIEPANVAPVNVRAYNSSNGKDGVELAYVGPNVRSLKGARTRVANPVRAEVAAKVQSARMDKGADLKPADLLIGLLGMVGSRYSATLQGMIETELGREIDWHQHGIHGAEDIADLKLPAKSLRRIAAGLAHCAISDKRHGWSLHEDIDKAVERRVDRDSAAARKAWIDEHTPPKAKGKAATADECAHGKPVCACSECYKDETSK